MSDIHYHSLSEEDKKFVIDASEEAEEMLREKLDLEARIKNEGIINLAIQMLEESRMPIIIRNRIVNFYNSVVENKTLSNDAFKAEMDRLIIATTDLKLMADVVAKGMADGVNYYAAVETEKLASSVEWLFDQYNDADGLMFITVSSNPVSKKPELFTHILDISPNLVINTHTRHTSLKDILWMDCYDEIMEDFEKRREKYDEPKQDEHA